MANVIINDENLYNIANAIRTKNGETTAYKPSEMADAIEQISISSENNAFIDSSLLVTFESTSNYSILNKMISKIDSIDVSHLKSISYLFGGCTYLTEITELNTTNVQYMKGLFSACDSLTTIPSIDTSNVTIMNYMFGGCLNMITIPLMDASKVFDISNAMYLCYKLVNIGGFKDLGKSFTIQTANYSSYCLALYEPSYSSSELTHESIMNVINNLYDLNLTYDVANGGTLYSQKLNLGATHIAKLTTEEIAIATSRGWTVS